jgi:hypothetical protein
VRRSALLPLGVVLLVLATSTACGGSGAADQPPDRDATVGARDTTTTLPETTTSTAPSGVPLKGAVTLADSSGYAYEVAFDLTLTASLDIKSARPGRGLVRLRADGELTTRNRTSGRSADLREDLHIIPMWKRQTFLAMGGEPSACSGTTWCYGSYQSEVGTFVLQLNAHYEPDEVRTIDASEFNSLGLNVDVRDASEQNARAIVAAFSGDHTPDAFAIAGVGQLDRPRCPLHVSRYGTTFVVLDGATFQKLDCSTPE